MRSFLFVPWKALTRIPGALFEKKHITHYNQITSKSRYNNLKYPTINNFVLRLILKTDEIRLCVEKTALFAITLGYDLIL